MDRFDEIWKNRFNDSKLPAEEWNSPDDDMAWDEIAAGIAPKKDKRKYLFLWWGLSAVAIMIAFALLLVKDNASSTEPKQEKPTEQMQLSMVGNTTARRIDSNTNTTIIKETFKNKAINQAVEDAFPKQITQLQSNRERVKELAPTKSSLATILPQTTKKIRTKNMPSFNDKKESMNNKVRATIKKTTSSSSLANVNATDLVKSQEVLATTNRELTSMKLDRISSLALTTVSYEEEVPPTLKEAFNFPELLVTSNKSNPFQLAFSAGMIYWKHRISDQYTSDLAAFDFNYTDNYAWQANVQLSYALNSYLSAFTGIQYEQVRSASGHNSNLKYDVLNEQDASNAYTQNLATPYGLSEANFRLNRQRAVNGDEIDLLVDFESRHLIHNWSMPIGLQVFPLGENSKWKPYTSVAFGVNYLAKITNTIHQIGSSHDAIQYENSGSESFAQPDIQNWHFDLRLGLGLSYEIFPSLSVGMNYDWSRGLNPIYQLENASSEQQNYETRIDRHHLSLRIIKTLGN
ncbi:MAG: autotransporter outer membrane beta-barrel domain-containing protein [Saprospiraceae bacterium]